MLETTRLRLRPLALSDAPALHPLFADPKVMRYWSDPPSEGLAETGRRLSKRLEKHTGHALDLALEHAGVFVGTISLFNNRDGVMEIGYLLAADLWGQGYASEACRAVLRFGFQEWDVHRVEAQLHPKNRPSARLLKRLGFKKEGYLRENFHKAGEYEDTLFMGLLRREWRG